MANQSPSISNSATATSSANSEQQQQQPIAGSSSSVDATAPPTATATVDSLQPQQQHQQPGGPGTSLGQQQHQPQQQYPPQLGQQQRWPPEAAPPGSSPAPTPQSQAAPGGMMLASPHYAQQQYAHQHHLGVPSPSLYANTGGYPGAPPIGQHSPNSRLPYPPPQMMHPAMMGYPPPHGYGPPTGPSPYGHPAALQHYWATRGPAPPNGPGMMGPPPPQSQQYEMPSTSRHTPQPQQQSQQQQHAQQQNQHQQMPAPSPSANNAASNEESTEENAAGLRPRSSLSQHPQQQQQQQQHYQHFAQQIPPQHQMAPPQMRYMPTMMPPPHGQQFQPPPMGHPGMGPAQMHHHMPPPTMHHPAAGPFPGHPGMYFPPPPHHPAAQAPIQQQQPQQQPQVGILPGLKPSQREAVDKLVMQMANPKQQQTPDMIYQRRLFYERLVLLNEQQGEILTGPPQVSKSTVDLYALYHSVKQKGGFEKTIRDKIWKNLCPEANCDMQSSSAAGFQLRKHYQKFLLKLECLENNLNANDLIEFAEKQKKKKKEKEKGEPPAAGPQTPSSSSSAPTNKDHPEQKQNEKQKTAAPATAAEQQQSQQKHMPPPPPSANGPPPPQFAAYPQGMALPPGSAYPPPPAGTEFAPAPPTSGYAIPPQFGQYPPQAHSQWAAAAAYQQQQQQQMAAAAAGSAGMYSSPQRPPQPLPPQMRPMQQPYPTGQQQAEDEQQHQQQRLASSSSRLSSTSTPVPAEQQHPSRSSSVAGGAQSTEKQEQSQAREDDQKEATAQQQRLQANTPSSSFSANAPTPPLTRSSNVFSTSMTSASGVPGTQQPPNSSATNQQQQMPPSAAGYYHPAAIYGRYPPPTQAGAVQPGDVYGPAPPAAIYHPAATPGQQPLWGSPYGMPPQQAARHFPPGTPVSRYPYTTQPQPAPPTTAAASNSPQLQVAPQTPQQQQSASGSKSASKSSASFPPYATPTRGGGGHSAAGGPPAGMVPAVPVPVPNAYSVPPHQQPPPPQPQQYPAWFGTATLSTLPPFPSQSLEAQTISQLQQQQQLLQQQRYRRPKVYARDLVGASPARIVMALRSGLHLETNWALNALNIQLHDDTTPNAQPSLVQTPELLNLLVDHFTVLLTLLYPKEFNEISLHLQSSHRPSASSPTPSKHCKLAKSDSQSTTAAFLVPKREWTKSPSLLDDRKSEQISLMVRPPAQASSSSSAAGTTQSNSTKRQQNFTMVSRLGRLVKLDSTAEMPDELAAEMERWAMGKQKENDEEEDEEEQSQNNAEIFPDFMQRIRRQIVDHIRERRALKKLVSFKCNSQKIKDEEEEHTSHKDELFSEDDEDKEMKERAKKQQQETLLENEQENGPRLFYRQAKPWEHWDRHCMDHSALVNRFTVLQNRHADELLGEMMNRCLAISNILRGFSFLPGQERPLAQHVALLRLLPALLMLMVDETSRKGAVGAADGQPKQFTFPRPPPEEEEAEKQMSNVKRAEGEQTATTAATSKMASSSAQQRQMVPAEVDSPKKWLLEVANQLRDDAFTILAHISPNLDLFDMDSSISWPIFDSLLHWTVSTDLQARDPLPPFGLIPPRHYALEILCKMSVLERNVDLLVSTGPWPRLEEFIRQLCSLICEEPPVREFAIVILNAICAACEPACFIATEQTNLLELLVAFLEAADANMTQIAQHQGIHTLRENPEIIGTSVGMLRRAALIMTQIVRHDRCRQHFHRLQHRLLQFTVSHFMDSRVAAMVADILFQMQRANGLGGRTSTRREANANENEQSSSQQQHQNQQESTQHMMESRKFSSTAVLQPPAPVEPELVFNGGPNAAAAAKAELGENLVENGDIQAETMPDDLANNHVPPSHGQNHQQQMAKSKGTKGGNNGNGRKRPRKSETPDSASTTSSSSSKTENINNNSNHIQQQQQPMAYEHGNWNGHSHGGHYSEGGVAHTKIELLDPTEKKAKLVGESVRERMRNNILQKKNGWIETSPILTTVGTTEMPLQNGTAEMHQNNNNNNDVKMEAHEEEEVDHDEAQKRQLLQKTSMASIQQNSEPSKLEMQPIASPTPNNTTGTTTPTTSGTNNNNNNVQTAAASSGSLTAVA